MKPYGVIIRRKELLSKKTLDKQVKTIHKRLKKNKNKVITYYTHERDPLNSKYHTHLCIYTEEDKKRLKDVFSRFIGSEEWVKNYKSYKGLDAHGKWGEIHIHEMYDDDDGVEWYAYLNYIDKRNTARILI